VACILGDKYFFLWLSWALFHAIEIGGHLHNTNSTKKNKKTLFPFWPFTIAFWGTENANFLKLIPSLIYVMRMHITFPVYV